jgi:predicted ester cyclase
MRNCAPSEAAKAVVRRNTEEVQGKGHFDIFEELFAEDFVDHTPQPGMTPDKPGVRGLYKAIREAFPDFHAVIHWQTADGEIVTTFKTYHGTHRGTFLGVAPTGRNRGLCLGTRPFYQSVQRQPERPWDRRRRHLQDGCRWQGHRALGRIAGDRRSEKCRPCKWHVLTLRCRESAGHPSNADL